MFRKEILPNGVRIVTEEMPQVRSVSIGLWVKVGSRDENELNNGISHFIEHLMFKGTTQRTAKQIAEELDAIGGQLNAFTAKEYTCYYAKVMDNHLDIAIDVLTDMFFNSLFDATEIEKEKNVVIEEIKMYEDTPDEQVHDIFASTVWQGHALGRPIIGNEQIINNIKRADIVNYYKTMYTPHNLVISVAGNIKHQEVLERLQPLFGHFNGVSAPKDSNKPLVNREDLGKYKDTEQVHLCMGTEGLPINHDHIYVLHVINSIMGGGISSRLFQNIREQRGLAYSVYSYQTSYQDAGLFTIYGGLSKNNLDQFMQLVIKEINDFREQSISPDELHRAKEQLKGSMFMGLESASSRMSRIGKGELILGYIHTPEEVANMIDKVTMDQVKNLAEKIFDLDKYSLTTVGPIKEDLPLAKYI